MMDQDHIAELQEELAAAYAENMDLRLALDRERLKRRRVQKALIKQLKKAKRLRPTSWYRRNRE